MMYILGLKLVYSKLELLSTLCEEGQALHCYNPSMGNKMLSDIKLLISLFNLLLNPTMDCRSITFQIGRINKS